MLCFVCEFSSLQIGAKLQIEAFSESQIKKRSLIGCLKIILLRFIQIQSVIILSKSFSSGLDEVSLFGVTLPTKISPGLTSAPT